MKYFVSHIPWDALAIGLASLLLVGIVQEESLISYAIVIGLAATMLWQGWGHHRRDKRRT